MSQWPNVADRCGVTARASIGYHEGEDLVFGINAAMSAHFDEMGDAIACLEGDASEYLEYRLLESLLPRIVTFSRFMEPAGIWE
jgi:hypothetical protein